MGNIVNRLQLNGNPYDFYLSPDVFELYLVNSNAYKNLLTQIDLASGIETVIIYYIGRKAPSRPTTRDYPPYGWLLQAPTNIADDQTVYMSQGRRHKYKFIPWTLNGTDWWSEPIPIYGYEVNNFRGKEDPNGPGIDNYPTGSTYSIYKSMLNLDNPGLPSFKVEDIDASGSLEGWNTTKMSLSPDNPYIWECRATKRNGFWGVWEGPWLIGTYYSNGPDPNNPDPNNPGGGGSGGGGNTPGENDSDDLSLFDIIFKFTWMPKDQTPSINRGSVNPGDLWKDNNTFTDYGSVWLTLAKKNSNGELIEGSDGLYWSKPIVVLNIFRNGSDIPGSPGDWSDSPEDILDAIDDLNKNINELGKGIQEMEKDLKDANNELGKRLDDAEKLYKDAEDTLDKIAKDLGSISENSDAITSTLTNLQGKVNHLERTSEGSTSTVTSYVMYNTGEKSYFTYYCLKDGRIIQPIQSESKYLIVAYNNDNDTWGPYFLYEAKNDNYNPTSDNTVSPSNYNFTLGTNGCTVGDVVFRASTLLQQTDLGIYETLSDPSSACYAAISRTAKELVNTYITDGAGSTIVQSANQILSIVGNCVTVRDGLEVFFCYYVLTKENKELVKKDDNGTKYLVAAEIILGPPEQRTTTYEFKWFDPYHPNELESATGFSMSNYIKGELCTKNLSSIKQTADSISSVIGNFSDMSEIKMTMDSITSRVASIEGKDSVIGTQIEQLKDSINSTAAKIVTYVKSPSTPETTTWVAYYAKNAEYNGEHDSQAIIFVNPYDSKRYYARLNLPFDGKYSPYPPSSSEPGKASVEPNLDIPVYYYGSTLVISPEAISLEVTSTIDHAIGSLKIKPDLIVMTTGNNEDKSIFTMTSEGINYTQGILASSFSLLNPKSETINIDTAKLCLWLTTYGHARNAIKAYYNGTLPLVPGLDNKVNDNCPIILMYYDGSFFVLNPLRFSNGGTPVSDVYVIKGTTELHKIANKIGLDSGGYIISESGNTYDRNSIYIKISDNMVDYTGSSSIPTSIGGTESSYELTSIPIKIIELHIVSDTSVTYKYAYLIPMFKNYLTKEYHTDNNGNIYYRWYNSSLILWTPRNGQTPPKFSIKSTGVSGDSSSNVFNSVTLDLKIPL